MSTDRGPSTDGRFGQVPRSVPYPMLDPCPNRPVCSSWSRPRSPMTLRESQQPPAIRCGVRHLTVVVVSGRRPPRCSSTRPPWTPRCRPACPADPGSWWSGWRVADRTCGARRWLSGPRTDSSCPTTSTPSSPPCHASVRPPGRPVSRSLCWLGTAAPEGRPWRLPSVCWQPSRAPTRYSWIWTIWVEVRT